LAAGGPSGPFAFSDFGSVLGLVYDGIADARSRSSRSVTATRRRALIRTGLASGLVGLELRSWVRQAEATLNQSLRRRRIGIAAARGFKGAALREEVRAIEFASCYIAPQEASRRDHFERMARLHERRHREFRFEKLERRMARPSGRAPRSRRVRTSRTSRGAPARLDDDPEPPPPLGRLQRARGQA
jgi:hypothetical protein